MKKVTKSSILINENISNKLGEVKLAYLVNDLLELYLNIEDEKKQKKSIIKILEKKKLKLYNRELNKE